MCEKSGSGSGFLPYDENSERFALEMKNTEHTENNGEVPVLTPFYPDTTTLRQEGDSVVVEG
jgi:hypothetical protein